MRTFSENHTDIRELLRAQASRIHSDAPPFESVTTRAELTVPTSSQRPARSRVKVGIAAGVCAFVIGGAAVAAVGTWPRAAQYRKSERSAASNEALADGRVTLQEYQAGFQRYRTCVAEAGAPLSDVRFDSATSLYVYTASGAPAAEGCYVKEFYALDLIWQTDPDRPGYAATPSADQVREACSRGAAVPGFDVPISEELCNRLNALDTSSTTP